ncbi:MAG: hypothetical protein HZA37_00790 [Parcubacteria group bacterium]|nr:hypothetical protein [Parcubacteria group bacterium]
MKKLIPVIIAASPMFAFAITNIEELITTLEDIVKAVIPLLMLIATVVFLWGIIGYIMAAGDEEKVKEARSHILYGLIGLFVMVSVWGLVNIIAGTLDLSSTTQTSTIPPNI